MHIRRWIVGLFVGLAIMLAVVVPALATDLFPDVPEDHPYATAIEDLCNKGIIGGYSDGTFGPDDPVVRQQFAKMVVKALDLTVTGNEVCPFVDVDAATGSDPFYPDKYVAVCAARNVTKGKDATHFDPWAKITRLQVVTMIVRAADNLIPGTLAGIPSGWSGQLSYADQTHGDNLKKAEYNGLLAGLQGLSASWNGYANASRAECAQLLYNLLLIQGGGAPSTTSTTHGTTSTSQSTTTTTVPSGSPLQVLLSSSQPDAPGDDNDNLNAEYITFKVLRAGSLQGYAVEDAASHRYHFPNRTFAVGNTFKLHTGSGTDSQTDLYWGSSSAIWNNNGDTINILDSQAHVLATYTY
jgi:hypothetical protein